jgi:hypothetical protein
VKGPINQYIVEKKLSQVSRKKIEKKCSGALHQKTGANPKHGHSLQVLRRQIDHQPVEVYNAIDDDNKV